MESTLSPLQIISGILIFSIFDKRISKDGSVEEKCSRIPYAIVSALTVQVSLPVAPLVLQQTQLCDAFYTIVTRVVEVDKGFIVSKIC